MISVLKESAPSLINSKYYCNLLDELSERIREKRPDLIKEKSFFITIMHRVFSKLNEFKYELLAHLYSSDFALTDYFKNLKQCIWLNSFLSNK